MRQVWSHDEKKAINIGYAVMAKKRCPQCAAINDKYANSHYTGGEPCVILTKYCRVCGAEL